jgi:predicted HTH domain antitoxin
MENVTTRMSEEELGLVSRLAAATGKSRSEVIRAAVRRGAREELLQLAIQRYRDGTVGMRGAAALAGLSITDMMHEANERGVLANYDDVDLDEELDALQ